MTERDHRGVRITTIITHARSATLPRYAGTAIAFYSGDPSQDWTRRFSMVLHETALPEVTAAMRGLGFKGGAREVCGAVEGGRLWIRLLPGRSASRSTDEWAVMYSWGVQEDHTWNLCKTKELAEASAAKARGIFPSAVVYVVPPRGNR